MKPLTLAFCVFKVFPYGGVSRDLFRITQACIARGHRVRIYTLKWDAPVQPECEVVIADVRAFTNHRLYARFSEWVRNHVEAHPVDALIGMNKMPDLTVYYAGDSCYEDKARTQRNWIYRLTARYRLFSRFERAVFDRDSKTEILTISDVQTPLFRKYYGTQYERLHALPPGIDASRRAPANASEVRSVVRREFGIDDDVHLIVFVGSGFIKKGLDRAIEGIAALPAEIRARTRMFVLGEDNAKPFRARAKRLGLLDAITFLGGRDDVPKFLFAADAFVLPAYDENTGTVIIEAMIAGLPVLVTENCGYARYVESAGAGLVVQMPYSQQSYNEKLRELLTSSGRAQWRANGVALGVDPQIYQLVDRAVALIESFARGSYVRPQPQPEVAFCLFKYFPFGGLQRNFLRTALALQALGYRIRVYTLSWEGRVPDRVDVVIVKVRGIANHRRYDRFAAQVARLLEGEAVASVVGFNKMAGLDVYYAADPCFEDKAQALRATWYRRTPRYKSFAAAERAVFGAQSATRIMLIAPRQQAVFERHYATAAERFTVLPPGIARDRMAPPNAADVRADLRAEFGIKADELLLLMVGSGFITKGLDRALIALSQLPLDLRSRCRFIAIGQDNPRSHVRMAARLGVADAFTLLPGRNDVPRFLQGADVLVHPAYSETAGNVLLEAVVAGLPVIVTDVCGNAPYIDQAEAGRVVPSPFSQEMFTEILADMLRSDDKRLQWRRNGVAFGQSADLYSLPVRAAEYIAAAVQERGR